MNPATSALIHLALVMVPTVAFLIAKRRLQSTPGRLLLAGSLAVVTGVAVVYLAAVHGWRPVTKSGSVMDLSPRALAAMTAGPLFLVLVVLTFSRKRKADEPLA